MYGNGNPVVVGQVVQGQVVQQPQPQPGYQGQAACQGTVVQPTMVGQPMGVPGYSAQDMQRRDDSNGAAIGWGMYAVGWFVCCCCGPCGPFFWFAVAAMYYCKPKAHRDQRPQEKVVAMVSLVTGCCCCVVSVMVIFALIIAIANASPVTFCKHECQSFLGGASSYTSEVCQDAMDKTCYPAPVQEEGKEVVACDKGFTECTQVDECPGACEYFEDAAEAGDVVCKHRTSGACQPVEALSGDCTSSDYTRCRSEATMFYSGN